MFPEFPREISSTPEPVYGHASPRGTRHVPQYPHASQLRAAGDGRGDPCERVAVRAQDLRPQQALEAERESLQPRCARRDARCPASARRFRGQRAAKEPRDRSRKSKSPQRETLREGGVKQFWVYRRQFQSVMAALRGAIQKVSLSTRRRGVSRRAIPLCSPRLRVTLLFFLSTESQTRDGAHRTACARRRRSRARC